MVLLSDFPAWKGFAPSLYSVPVRHPKLEYQSLFCPRKRLPASPDRNKKPWRPGGPGGWLQSACLLPREKGERQGVREVTAWLAWAREAQGGSTWISRPLPGGGREGCCEPLPSRLELDFPLLSNQPISRSWARGPSTSRPLGHTSLHTIQLGIRTPPPPGVSAALSQLAPALESDCIWGLTCDCKPSPQMCLLPVPS